MEGSWDPDRLSQIFRNLLGNALKYSPNGGEVVVRVEDRGDAAEVSIRDNGLGMSSEVLSKLFERSYRADAVVGAAQGLGLGLYITRQLVEAHGVRIWTESDGPGAGSTCCFTLPSVAATDETQSSAVDPARPRS